MILGEDIALLTYLTTLIFVLQSYTLTRQMYLYCTEF